VLVAVPAAGGEPRWAVPRGKQAGALLHPKYMLLHDGRLYIADWGNDRVLAFEASTGRCVLTVDAIAGPWGLAKLDGHIFVTSGNGHEVLKLSFAGERVHSWGGHGSGEGQFNSPLGITVLDGQLFVADRGNHRLQCFSPDGRFLRTFGAHGHGPTDFNFPYGLAEHERLLYVSDIGHDVRVFTPGGELVGPEDATPPHLEGVARLLGRSALGSPVCVADCGRDCMRGQLPPPPPGSSSEPLQPERLPQ
jgi:outer membrane protein assembly factor BamB